MKSDIIRLTTCTGGNFYCSVTAAPLRKSESHSQPRLIRSWKKNDPTRSVSPFHYFPRWLHLIGPIRWRLRHGGAMRTHWDLLEIRLQSPEDTSSRIATRWESDSKAPGSYESGPYICHCKAIRHYLARIFRSICSGCGEETGEEHDRAFRWDVFVAKSRPTQSRLLDDERYYPRKSLLNASIAKTLIN